MSPLLWRCQGQTFAHPQTVVILHPASHPGGDVDRMHSLRQGALQVLQWVQALDFAAPAIDELPKGVLLQQGLHVLEEEALTEQGQLWGIVDLWVGRELRHMVFVYHPQFQMSSAHNRAQP